MAKLCKHFSNEKKTFTKRRKLLQRQKIYFSKSRQRAENLNLGPLKHLDGLIDEVLPHDSANSYLRKQVIIGRTVTDLATFQKKGEKSHFPTSIWKSSSK